MSHLNTRTPTGDDVTQRSEKKPAFSNDLLEQVFYPENLQRAWKQVRANKGAAGIDGMSIDEFPAWVRAGHWKAVESDLKTGSYQPSPVRRVEIDKPDGGKRQLGIPTVIDRAIQQAIAQVLTPIFDPGFSTSSFGFRPGRNGQQAIRQVQHIIKAGRRYSVNVDLSKFFDRVNHDLLMTYLGYKVEDKRLLGLIGRYLRAGIIDNQLFIALPTCQNQPVSTGLDQLLWHRQLLSTLRRAGSLDSSSGSHGILAAVAQAAYQSKESVESRCSYTIRSGVWHHQ